MLYEFALFRLINKDNKHLIVLDNCRVGDMLQNYLFK